MSDNKRKTTTTTIKSAVKKPKKQPPPPPKKSNSINPFSIAKNRTNYTHNDNKRAKIDLITDIDVTLYSDIKQFSSGLCIKGRVSCVSDHKDKMTVGMKDENGTNFTVKFTDIFNQEGFIKKQNKTIEKNKIYIFQNCSAEGYPDYITGDFKKVFLMTESDFPEEKTIAGLSESMDLSKSYNLYARVDGLPYTGVKLYDNQIEILALCFDKQVKSKLEVGRVYRIEKAIPRYHKALSKNLIDITKSKISKINQKVDFSEKTFLFNDNASCVDIDALVCKISPVCEDTFDFIPFTSEVIDKGSIDKDKNWVFSNVPKQHSRYVKILMTTHNDMLFETIFYPSSEQNVPQIEDILSFTNLKVIKIGGRRTFLQTSLTQFTPVVSESVSDSLLFSYTHTLSYPEEKILENGYIYGVEKAIQLSKEKGLNLLFFSNFYISKFVSARENRALVELVCGEEEYFEECNINFAVCCGEMRKTEKDIFKDDEFMKCQKCTRLSIPKQRFNFVAQVAFLDNKEAEREKDIFENQQSDLIEECLNYHNVIIKDSAASEIMGVTAKDFSNERFDQNSVIRKRYCGMFEIKQNNDSFIIELKSVYNLSA